MKTINRREWLKSSALLSSLLLASPVAFAKEQIPSPKINPFTGQWLRTPSMEEVKARLSSNENPFGPSKKAMDALKAALPDANRYAFKQAEELEKMIAEYHGVAPESVILGAGSLELLTLMGNTFGAREGAVLTAFPTFEPLMRVMMQLNCDWQQVNVNEKGETDFDAIEKEANSKTRLVYVVNPNNPTGTQSDTAKLKDFCKRMTEHVPVFVDEAYNEYLEDYQDHTVINLLKEGVPVTVARTLSKAHGFAGLRVGYLVGPVPMIERMKTYRPWVTTLSGPSIAAAKATLTDEDILKTTREKNAESRSYTVENLKSIGYSPFDSKTNFVFFPLQITGEEYINKMSAEGIEVSAWEYNDKSWGRVSIGTKDEMKSFIEAMKKTG
ncbi:MAG: pyridoxal phosphate-dependent aminotransferase [Candidatus Cyclobacteriaceae bacterium M2_1C_046]